VLLLAHSQLLAITNNMTGKSFQLKQIIFIFNMLAGCKRNSFSVAGQWSKGKN